MLMWRILDYFTEQGTCPIREWYVNQAPAVRAAFDATVFILRGINDWLAPEVKEFKLLDAPHEGLGEIRFDVEERGERGRMRKRRFRPAGLYRPEQREFVLLVGCEKGGRNYWPPKPFDQALKYKALFEQGRGVTGDHF